MFKKIKGRYAERKVNNERTVISYEDVPLDDYEPEKTDISLKAVRKIILGVLLSLVMGLIVFAFANRDVLTWDNISVWWNYEVMGTAGKGFPVNLIGADVDSGNVAVHQNRVAYASDTSFVTLNSTGKEVSNFHLRYTKPVMKASENRFLTFGLGETAYQVHSFDSKLYSGTAEGGIFAGDIASNGRYCIVIEGNGYYSELFAYDKNNNRIFKYSFSEYYINSVAINKDGSGCIASGISNNSGEIKSCIYVLNFSDSTPRAKYEINGDYIIDSKFINDDSAALVGGNAAYVVKFGGGELKTIGYEEKELSNYCFNTDSATFSLALSRSGDGKNCDLITYNENGDMLFSINSSYGSKSLSSYKGSIATLDNNIIYLFNDEGELKYSCFAGTGSKRVMLCSGSEAFVLSVNQVRKIDLSTEASPDSAR